MTFQAPKVIPGLDAEPNRQLVQSLGQIENDLSALGAGQLVTPIKTTDFNADIGQLVRMIPPAAGARILLPQSTTQNQGEQILVSVESVASGGTVSLLVVGGKQTINGVASLTLTISGLTLCESTSVGWIAISLGAAGSIPLTSLAAQAANTVVANATAGVASPTAFPVGLNTVLGRVAGNIVAAQLVAAQVTPGTLTNSTLANMAGNTFKGEGTGVASAPQDIAVAVDSIVGRFGGNLGAQAAAAQSTYIKAAGNLFNVTFAANQVLRRSGAGDLGAGLLVDGNMTTNTLTAASQAQMAANTIKSNATAALANESDLTVGTNTVVGRVAGNIVAAQLVAAQVTNNTLNYAQIAQPAANTMPANATAGVANLADLAVGTNTVVGRVAGNIVAAQLVGAQVTAATLPLTTLATQAAKSVVANATNSVASPTALAGSAPRQYLRVNDANTALEFARISDGVKTAATVVSAATTVLACTGTYTIPANSLAVGSRFIVNWTYQYIRGATATAHNLTHTLNGGAGLAFVIARPANLTAGTYQMRVFSDFTVLTTGAGGTCMVNMAIYGPGITDAADVVARYASSLAGAINTTISNAVSGTVAMSAIVAATSITATGGHIDWVA